MLRPHFSFVGSSSIRAVSRSEFISSFRSVQPLSDRFRKSPTTSPRKRELLSLQNDSNENGHSKKRTQVSRRKVIQFINAGLGLATVGLLVKMKEQFRFMSPKAVLSAFGISGLPQRNSTSSALAATNPPSTQIRDALEYIRRIESYPPILCPDFPQGADWMNSRPLSLRKQLAGKLILLDFFTYCCINCQHVLPKLRALEVKYGEDGSGGVVVVGVHSAKFSAERETANVAAAVDRYNVRHPVINDERMKLWNALGVSSWPTLALISPSGRLLAMWSGEQQEGDIGVVIAAALEYYAESIDHRPLPTAPKRSALFGQLSASPLRYPGKVALSQNQKQLYIADSGNNRILLVDLGTGRVIRSFGSGEPGLHDAADANAALFNSPQGIVENNDVVYVADTESHAVRAINLRTGAVSTVGGTGEQGFDYTGGKVGTSQKLSSPWDVEIFQGYLYVAMAGTHQIWRIRLPPSATDDARSNTWEVFSGSGRELEKNSTVGRIAGWAQPSHLSSSTNGLMFVADSESSTLRAIDLVAKNNPTRTVAGGDGLLPQNLFAFGDKEGRGANAKFQHCLAVCFDEANNQVFVADSYNHRIKVVDDSGFVRDFCGCGTPGYKDGSPKEAMFWEPGGLALSADGSKLYVSDTNNFAVRIVDTQTREVSTLQLSSAPLAEMSNASKPLISNRRRAKQIFVTPIARTAILNITIYLPDQSHFTPGTTSRYQVNRTTTDSGHVEILEAGIISKSKEFGSFTVDLSNKHLEDVTGVEVETVSYYCTEEDEVCRVESDVFVVDFSEDGSKSASFTHNIKPRKPMTTTRMT